MLGSLTQPMAECRVPGLAVATVWAFRLDAVHCHGWANAETHVPANPSTCFQAGSLSKAVTAAAALRALAEGRIGLDQSINRVLRSWQLPENEHTRAAPVTLRHLLGHTAGTTVPGYFGYFAEEPLPTLLQVLDGRPPAKTPPVRVEFPPGTAWRYSGGGYCVVQQALMDAYDRPFSEIAQANVLSPVGMNASIFTERLTGPRADEAAWAHRSDGSVLQSQWLGYPELAAAGLWSTPSDLARFVIALQRALQGEEGGGLLPGTATQMVDATTCGSYGLGLELQARAWFGHSGANPGYASLFIGHRTAGCGAAMMANSEHGRALFPQVLRMIAKEYGWPDRGA